ncbi:MAG: hypothetical protein U1C74_09200 [Phenylobacterium sp.]|nr:hypothetical protein [Phenylobacterium sp.]
MNKQHDNNTDSTLNRFKEMTPVQQMEIVERAVEAILDNLAAVETAKKAAQKVETNQLAALKVALKDYAEPMTEEAWEKVYCANVQMRLSEAKVDGSPRYKNNASRDVMVNLIKVATMGLTLAKQDKDFAPSHQVAGNLKKYANEVRPKLQQAIDPATGKPRLRSIAVAPKPPKKLPPETYYWLIGCENAAKGIRGANTVVGGGSDLKMLEDTAKRLADKYESFLYCAAKMETLVQREEEEKEELLIQNSAVFSQSFSPSSELVSV